MGLKRWTMGYAGCMVVLAAAYFVLTEMERLTGLTYVLWTTMGVLGVAAIIFGIRRNTPSFRMPWVFLAASSFSFVVGDVCYNVLEAVFHQQDPFPSVADIAYLGLYLFAAAALIMFIKRQLNGRRDTLGMVDALIAATAPALIVANYLIPPIMTATDMGPSVKILAVAYPVADVFLLVLLFRLLFINAYTRATQFMAVGAIGLISSDIVYGLSQIYGNYTAGWIDAGWIIFYAMWGLSALHPSMRQLTEPPSGNATGIIRIVFLVLAALVGPLLLGIAAASSSIQSGVLVPLFAAITVVLIIFRVMFSTRER